MNLIAEQIVPAGQPWSAVIKREQRLRIVDIEGNQGVDFLCYSAANPEERYHAANTLKKSQTLLLTTGHTLYSDVARPLMTIVDDTCGMHDTIGGCCSAPSNEMLYGVKNAPGCREQGRQLHRAAGRHGRARRHLQLPAGQQSLQQRSAHAHPRGHLRALRLAGRPAGRKSSPV